MLDIIGGWACGEGVMGVGVVVWGGSDGGEGVMM